MEFTIEIVYATADAQVIKKVLLSQVTTIEDAIVRSGILEACKDIDLTSNKVGIHGVIKPLTEIVKNSDRIEIYRPVTAKN